MYDWGQHEEWRSLSVTTSLFPLGLLSLYTDPYKRTRILTLHLGYVAILFLWALNLVTIPESPRFLLIAGRQQEGWDLLGLAARENRSVLFRQKLIRWTTSDG